MSRIRRIRTLLRSRRAVLPALILCAGMAVLVALLLDRGGAPELARRSPQWTQPTQRALAAVPACTSSSASAPTCTASGPSTTVTWNYNGNEGACSAVTLVFQQTSPVLWENVAASACSSTTCAASRVFTGFADMPYGFISSSRMLFVYRTSDGYSISASYDLTTGTSRIENNFLENDASGYVPVSTGNSLWAFGTTTYNYSGGYWTNRIAVYQWYRNPPADVRWGGGALGSDGKVYIAKNSSLYKYDPSGTFSADGSGRCPCLQGSWVATSTPHNHGLSPSVAQYNGLIYVIGGTATKIIDIYNPATDSWATGTETLRLPGAPTGFRSHAPAVVAGNEIYIIGGKAGGSPISYVVRYNPATNRVRSVQSLPQARAGAGAFLYGDRIHVLGGRDSAGKRTDIIAYRFRDDSSAAVTGVSCTATSYAWTGGRPNTSYNYTVGIYNSVGDTIDTTNNTGSSNTNPIVIPNCLSVSCSGGQNPTVGITLPVIWAARGFGGTVGSQWSGQTALPFDLKPFNYGVIDGRIHLVGLATSSQARHLEFNPGTGIWDELPRPPSAVETILRDNLAVRGHTVVNGTLYLLRKGGTLANYRYSPSTGWTSFTISTFSSVLNRNVLENCYCSGWDAVPLDGKLYTGVSSNRQLRIFDPANLSWTTTNRASPISRPYEFRIAAVGSRIYIFGGESTSGGRAVDEFNTSTGAFTTKTSIPYAPLETYRTTAFQSQIYVIGVSGDNQRRTMIYDPQTDRWAYAEAPLVSQTDPAYAVVGNTFYLMGGRVPLSSTSFLATNIRYRDPYRYRWSGTSELGGTGATIERAYNQTGTFSASVEASEDGTNWMNPVSCGSVVVQNAPPRLTMGPSHSVAGNTSHQHDGTTVTDADGDLASYRWEFEPIPSNCGGIAFCPSITANSSGTLSGGATSSVSVPGPVFTPTQEGIHTLRLTVTDAAGNISAGLNTDSVTFPPSSPVIDTMGTPHTIYYGDSHSHSGAIASDVNNNLSHATWDFTSCPGSCPLLGGRSSYTCFVRGGTPPTPVCATLPTATSTPLGDYVLRLRVYDFTSRSATGQITEQVRLPPLAGGASRPECNDGLDNDSDGTMDHADSIYRSPPYQPSIVPADNGCSGLTDTNERSFTRPVWIEVTPN